ncbi:hypothetical protein [Streptomyces sp. NPDC000229]|uniref:hypothetical protein n=1 Tax=Streptomyces sp. NPDC000229 TaxID=3154247 RepID=UPI00332FE2F1
MTFPALEVRPDGDEWIVGRQDTGQVVAVPQAGMEALRLLTAGCSTEEARTCLRERTGQDLDVQAFAEGLARAGLVTAIGDRSFEAQPVRMTLPAVRPRHVRWMMSPALHCLVMAVALMGPVVALAHPEAVPSWGDLLWSPYGTFTLLLHSVVAWILILVHEMAHLLTARAAGVAGRLSLGTRLQFLVAQTEVSGIWLRPRRDRLTVYLSGLVLDGAIASICLMAIAAGAESPLLSIVVLTLVTSAAVQCLVFMRTDVYFVVQDLSGCRNLYGDSTAYLRHLGACLLRRPSANPLAERSRAERRALRTFTAVMVSGTLGCLAMGALLFRYVTWPLLTRAVTALATEQGVLVRLDALATILVLCGVQILWARLWWRRHGGTALRIRRSTRPAAPNDPPVSERRAEPLA